MLLPYLRRQQQRAEIAMFWSRIGGDEGSGSQQKIWLHPCVMRLRIDFPKSRLGFRRDSDYPIQVRMSQPKLSQCKYHY
ncbi:hypothetical protein Hanom_Chr13g01236201 [Helianthus anomalus]